MKNFTFYLCILFSIQFCSGQLDQSLKLQQKTYKSASGKEILGFTGSLMVSENRSNPKAEQIPIHFVQLKSTNPNPKAPIIYLSGGPGGSSSWQADDARTLDNWLPYLELGDVILLDQRGTGKGMNRVLYIWQKAIPENVLVSAEEFSSHLTNIFQEALVDFKKRGVDLNGYTSLENAKDIDALRSALGYPKVSLMGFSYGTHLGQTYIKYFEDRVSHAVLLGVEGLNHTYKLPLSMDIQMRKIALLAKEDPAIHKAIPDLTTLYEKVVKNLRKNPISLEVVSPLTNTPMPIKIGPYGLNMILRLDIGDASDLPIFPRLLYSIDQGDYAILKWFVQKRISAVFGVQGMSQTMDIASGATPSRLARIAEESQQSFFKNVINPGAIEGWPTPDLGASFRTPLTSKVRTLFMSGTLDFNTPPYQAEEVRWGFPNSSHLILTNAGHEQIITHPEAHATIIRFLKGENVDTIALAYPPLQFIPLTGASGDIWHPALEK